MDRRFSWQVAAGKGCLSGLGECRMLYHAGAYAAANAAYDKLYPQLREKGTFLFEYGHSPS